MKKGDRNYYCKQLEKWLVWPIKRSNKLWVVGHVYEKIQEIHLSTYQIWWHCCYSRSLLTRSVFRFNLVFFLTASNLFRDGVTCGKFALFFLLLSFRLFREEIFQRFFIVGHSFLFTKRTQAKRRERKQARKFHDSCGLDRLASLTQKWRMC